MPNPNQSSDQALKPSDSVFSKPLIHSNVTTTIVLTFLLFLLISTQFRNPTSEFAQSFLEIKGGACPFGSNKGKYSSHSNDIKNVLFLSACYSLIKFGFGNSILRTFLGYNGPGNEISSNTNTKIPKIPYLFTPAGNMLTESLWWSIFSGISLFYSLKFLSELGILSLSGISNIWDGYPESQKFYPYSFKLFFLANISHLLYSTVSYFAIFVSTHRFPIQFHSALAQLFLLVTCSYFSWYKFGLILYTMILITDFYFSLTAAVYYFTKGNSLFTNFGFSLYASSWILLRHVFLTYFTYYSYTSASNDACGSIFVDLFSGENFANEEKYSQLIAEYNNRLDPQSPYPVHFPPCHLSPIKIFLIHSILIGLQGVSLFWTMLMIAYYRLPSEIISRTPFPFSNFFNLVSPIIPSDVNNKTDVTDIKKNQ